MMCFPDRSPGGVCYPCYKCLVAPVIYEAYRSVASAVLLEYECVEWTVCINITHKTQSFNFIDLLSKQSKDTAIDISNTFTTRSENDYKRSGVPTPSNVREFKRFAKQIHGRQYKLVHFRLEAKMATSVVECILRAMFVNSNVLLPRSRPRVKF